ncbi:MAG: glycine zipper 2TM domain-containing protein [Hyphomicrobiales bacterium]
MTNVSNLAEQAPLPGAKKTKTPRALRNGAIALMALTALAGCQSYGAGPREGVGALGGAVAGGVLGSQIGSGSGQVLATVGGAVLGGLLGAELGRQLDAQAQQRYYQAQFQALETGRPGAPVAWQSPTGPRGQVVPGQTYQINSTRCRDYTHTVYIQGQPEVLTGTACRQSDGTWRDVG